LKIWKCLGKEELEQLTEPFNVIFRTAKIPSEWRTGTIIPLYKNKVVIQDCGKYWGIKLLSHTIKLRKG